MKIHHVGWVVKPEDMDGVKELWSKLGVELGGISAPDLGLRVLLSIDAGVEIVTHEGEGGVVGPMLKSMLDTRGPGVLSVAMEVDDIDAAVHAMEAAGGQLVHRGTRVLGEEHGGVHVEGAMFAEICGMGISFEKFSSPEKSKLT